MLETPEQNDNFISFLSRAFTKIGVAVNYEDALIYGHH